jgi:hypothetical protein
MTPKPKLDPGPFGYESGLLTINLLRLMFRMLFFFWKSIKLTLDCMVGTRHSAVGLRVTAHYGKSFCVQVSRHIHHHQPTNVLNFNGLRRSISKTRKARPIGVRFMRAVNFSSIAISHYRYNDSRCFLLQFCLQPEPPSSFPCASR